MGAMEQFAPFERWLEELTKKGKPIPQLSLREAFREGYMLALRDGHVVWRDDRAGKRA